MTQGRRESKDQGRGPASGGGSAQLGGARAEFVASLGRKVEQARELLGAVGANPTSAEPREEMRRRLHALGAAAKMMHFDVMVRSLGEADAIFDRVAKAGSIGVADIAEIAQILDDLPALAWGDVPRDRTAAEPARATPSKRLERTCLLFGSEMLAEALTDEAYDGATFACERSEHVQAALGLARSIAPDVVVVDADVASAAELVEALLDDPLTEPVPILVVGAFASPDQTGRFIALGVGRTIQKPITPENLRAACDEAIAAREGRTVRLSLGEPTLEQLGERLAEEVRQALVGSVDRAGRTVHVPLGEGSEVMGAIWGAIARVREVVTARTDGAVRFGSRGPEGSVQLAPWLHQDVARGDRATARARGPAAEVRLAGRRVVVADDDPGVTWFIADLLRTAGCEVFEALDGDRALELAYARSPELVVSDILMPGMDGFALCRALRRDVALRDAPVILLSWKEDLLQRVRELGASAAAYLRKESDSRAIVARVREALRPRARVEARVKAGGEVGGRLDGLGARTLLDLACTHRPDSRVSVRDASFLYEIEIRDGAPKRATRTAGDGSFQRGHTVLASMLGIGAARFLLSDSRAAITSELRGSLAEQLAPAIAHARGAAYVTTGARMMAVGRVILDEEAVEAYARATPDAAAEVISRLGAGASPRELVVNAGADHALVEDVLADLAARGAIMGVLDASSNDVLGPAIERARALVEGRAPERAPVSSGPRPSRPAITPDALATSPDASPSLPIELRAPSSLEDAVMRELSERSPRPASARPISTSPPPIVEPANLKPRISSRPPPKQAPEPEPSAEAAPPEELEDGNAGGPTVEDPTDLDTVLSAEQTSQPEPSAQLSTRGASIPIVVETSQPPLAVTEGTGPSVAPERSERTPLESIATAEAGAPPRPSGNGRWAYTSIIAGATAVVWVALSSRGSTPPEPRPAAQETAVTNAILAPRAAELTSADLPGDAGVSPGEGLFELIMPAEAPIKIDGVSRGRGPRLALGLEPGSHELLVGAEDKPRLIEVRAGRATRLELPETP